MEIIKVLRKRMPVLVKQVRVGDLDKAKCSTRFLSHNFNDDMIVNVKCHEDGTFEFRGKRQEYRIIVPDNELSKN